MEAAVASGVYSSLEQIVQPTLDDWKGNGIGSGRSRKLRLYELRRERYELWREEEGSENRQPLDLDSPWRTPVTALACRAANR